MRSRISLGTVIAKRELVSVGPKGRRKVSVRVGKPRRRRTGEWECPFVVTGLGPPRTSRAFGEDALQALQLALEGLHAQLAGANGSVTWLGLPVAVAFPRQVPSFDEKLAERLTDVIDREIVRWTRKVRARRAPATRGRRGSRLTRA